MRTKVRIQSTSTIFIWRALRNFAMADFEKNVQEMMGRTREEAGGDRVRRGRDRDETGGPGDETSDKTAATAGAERDSGDRLGNVYGRRSVYNRRLPSLFGEHCEILRWQTLRKTFKRCWGRLEKRWVATVSGGNETGDETGSHSGTGDETGDKTAAMAGDE